MTRDAYARMATGLVLAGADEAIADMEKVAKASVAKRPSLKTKTHRF
jgi:hypothetical protein